jgi:hypothetical protein
VGTALSAAGIYAVLKRFFRQTAKSAEAVGLDALRFEKASTYKLIERCLRYQNQCVSCSSMTVWEKLITSPDWGPRTGSPLARAALGLCALYFALHTIFTGAIRMNKAAPIFYIHFADHPIVVH